MDGSHGGPRPSLMLDPVPPRTFSRSTEQNLHLDFEKSSFLREKALHTLIFRQETLDSRETGHIGSVSFCKAPLSPMSKQKHSAVLPDKIDPSAPLRLDIAAKLAFPDGSMTVSGLRREGARGRLALERIANKDYTTLEAIWNMRQLCRVQAKESAYTSGKHDTTETSSLDRPFGSSRMAIGMSPQDALRIRLKQGRRQEPSKL